MVLQKILPVLISLVVFQASVWGDVEDTVPCRPSGPASSLTIGNSEDGSSLLCWNGEPVRLSGYSGDFSQVNLNEFWDDGNAECSESTSPDITAFLNNARGLNLIRHITTGGHCQNGWGKNSCIGYLGLEELMPFDRIRRGKNAGKFNITGRLDRCYLARLRFFLKETRARNMLVMISLFDQNGLVRESNPWNLRTNNAECPRMMKGSNDVESRFYRICSDTSSAARCNATLNCLGEIQKNFVQQIVRFVNEVGTANVLYEIMNEAELSTDPKEDLNSFGLWHEVVSGWVKDPANCPECDQLLVAASVKKGGSAGVELSLLERCGTEADCPMENPYRIFWTPGIDIVNLHFKSWSKEKADGVLTDQMCLAADSALKFKKPVVFDTDGGSPNRNDNAKLREWASATCGRRLGMIHFYHSGDGMKMRRRNPDFCEEDDERFVDCRALEAITGVVPGTYCERCFEVDRDPTNSHR